MATSPPEPIWTGTAKSVLGLALLAQFGAAYLVGTAPRTDGALALGVPAVAFTLGVPVLLFLLAYALSDRFRSFVLAQDIRTLTTLQLWRVVGFAFLPLYAVGVLPGVFAWPAGLGDVAVGIAAFFVVRRLDRDAAFVKSTAFIGFNLLGLLDFVVAVGTGRLSGATAIDAWPIIVFPGFLVPVFAILHLAVLLKVRHLRRRAGAADPLPAAAG